MPFWFHFSLPKIAILGNHMNNLQRTNFWYQNGPSGTHFWAKRVFFERGPASACVRCVVQNGGFCLASKRSLCIFFAGGSSLMITTRAHPGLAWSLETNPFRMPPHAPSPFNRPRRRIIFGASACTFTLEGEQVFFRSVSIKWR